MGAGRRSIAFVFGVVLAAAAAAQAPSADNTRADELGREARRAGASGDLARARTLFRSQIELAPGDFQARYNLARVEAALGDPAEGLAQLRAATEHGFDDLRRLRRDPMMASVRALEGGAALEASWGETLAAQLERNLAASARFAPEGSRIVRDPDLRIAILTSWDPRIVAQAREELTTLAAWAEGGVFPGLSDVKERELDPWVVVVLPDKAGFERWQTWYFGGRPMGAGSYASVGGAYDQDTKRLVARDLGSTLRHEFMHVLHWRACSRVGQSHPVWLQEGLCSLVEDYDIVGGKLRPAPSYRTNTAKRLAKIGGLLPIATLTSMERDRFLGTRPMASYAQARTLFLFLAESQKLDAWYGAFVEAFGKAPGDAGSAAAAAFESAFGMAMAEVEKSYRAFVRSLPDVPEQIASGGASLGVEVETGSGDGPVVVSIRRTDGVGLRVGDIIQAIDGKPTRDTPELVRVLSAPLGGLAGGYSPGDSVTVRVRRGGTLLEIPLALVAR
jgi:hypothetical protein